MLHSASGMAVPAVRAPGEKIAAAFVLNRMDYLPENYSDVIEAWERLDDWQVYVKKIKHDYMHLIKESGVTRFSSAHSVRS